MNRRYDDIISRTNTAPIWWQQEGVPRYEAFDPYKSPGIYAREAALAEIATQCCETTFLVLIETSYADRRIAASIRNESLDYGDPPNVWCCKLCCPSASSVLIRVVEYWSIDAEDILKWGRDSALEIVFQDPWGGGGPIPPRGERWIPGAE